MANAFEYSASLTPNITSISPTVLTVIGETVMYIQGTSLNSTAGVNPKVTIGKKPCIVINATDSEIYCMAPDNAPGRYPLTVIVEGKGLALNSQPLDYILSVNKVYPNRGSVLGGTVLTLEGSGFLKNASRMHIGIGKTKCSIISSNDGVVKCKTKQSTKVVVVDNSGKHAGSLLRFLNFLLNF